MHLPSNLPYLLVFTLIVMASRGIATEEAKYSLVDKDGAFEVRDYEPSIVAEVVVDTEFERAGNAAFSRLFRYISGGNRSKEKIAMTAPVSQEEPSTKIEMTSPVAQQSTEAGWGVSFMMPSSFTMETLPEPLDPGITLRQVSARRMAAVRYSGNWTEAGYLNHKDKLKAWIEKQGLKITGEPVWARYDPPFQLWFLRRNEILIPVQPE